MKRSVLIGVGVAIAVAIVVVLVIVFSQGGNDASPSPTASVSPSATPSVTPSPVPTPPSTAAPEVVGDDGTSLVLPFVVAESAMREDPDVPLALEEVATGSALEDLTVSAIEFAENGMIQIGSPVVVSATVTEIDAAATPPTTKILACLDYSGVDIQSPDGESLKADDAPERVPTILTLVQLEGRWLVSARTFPEEATC